MQFNHALTEREMYAMQQIGGKVSEYVNANSYIVIFAVGAKPDISSYLGALGYIKVAPEWKLHPNLKDLSRSPWARYGDFIKTRIVTIDGLESGLALADLLARKGIRKAHLLNGCI